MTSSRRLAFLLALAAFHVTGIASDVGATDEGEVSASTLPSAEPPDALKAALFSALIPGAGQIYGGDSSRGWVLVVLGAALVGTATAGYLLKQGSAMQFAGAGLVVLTVGAPIDAYLRVRSRNAQHSQGSATRSP